MSANFIGAFRARRRLVRFLALSGTLWLLAWAAAQGAALPAACDALGASALLTAVNAARAQPRQCGATFMAAAPPLGWSSVLEGAAREHSSDMATRNFFSHVGSNGSEVGQRVHAAGAGWSAAAENIAGGPSSVAEVMADWLSSPGHCANIMGPAFRLVGVACVERPGSRYGRYWTMVLTRP
ncbi:CAP domain-containing protein [Hydrogenophaga sp. RWCD_12]|uniref:CAP domain-containing protein n=1 Tax=Hydrogenophaga sp. RWCD_12 TaxID=3391190 RepID=UPI0039852003